MEADDASPHVNTAPYPVTDGDGYYMAYKDGDTWVNWWAKPKWGLLGVLSQFLFTKVSKEVVIQCPCSEWPTGSGKKLSSSQAQLRQATCLAVA